MDYRLSVDDSKEKPFSCVMCGRTYDPCGHWSHKTTCTKGCRPEWDEHTEECIKG